MTLLHRSRTEQAVTQTFPRGIGGGPDPAGPDRRLPPARLPAGWLQALALDSGASPSEPAVSRQERS